MILLNFAPLDLHRYLGIRKHEQHFGFYYRANTYMDFFLPCHVKIIKFDDTADLLIPTTFTRDDVSIQSHWSIITPSHVLQ